MSELVRPETWNEYLGSVWRDLLASHSMGASDSVVEIGPGFTDKVGLGLAEHGFRGTLFVVEPNRAARSWVAARYRELLPDAQVVPIAEPIASAGRVLPASVGGLLMNHVLDDLVLSAALPADRRNRIFGGILDEKRNLPAVVLTWQRLLAETSRLDELRCNVLNDLESLLDATDPRVFAASQYSSWFLTRNDLEAVNHLGAGLIVELGARVGTTSVADRAMLARRGQDPGHWVVCERRPEARP